MNHPVDYEANELDRLRRRNQEGGALGLLLDCSILSGRYPEAFTVGDANNCQRWAQGAAFRPLAPI